MDLLGALTGNTRRFVAVLRDVDGRAPVPTCPDWCALDLAWHLAEVQAFWTDVVTHRRTEAPDASAPRPGERPDSLSTCLDRVEMAGRELHTALAEASDDLPVWSWHERGGSVGWVRRRQAHEALVHRLDAEATAGTAATVPDDLAVDGIDELLAVYVEGIPDWGTFRPSGRSVRVATDGSPRSWLLSLGRMTGTSPATARTYDLPAAILQPDAAPDLSMTGPAPAVHAWLWGRGPLEPLRLEGELDLASDLRDLIADATQ